MNIQTSTIAFNKPYFTGSETDYIKQAVQSCKISGDGLFTKNCHTFFEERYGFQKVLLTTSCSDALEMCALLLNIEEGDEVIMPAYTFVSTANAFALRGATIRFADSEAAHPNMDTNALEALITTKTKAIVVVHYAGMACDMGKIQQLCEKYNLFLVEDAAQAIDNYYIDATGKKIPLGSIGHLAAFSFHETKNVISGEGGMLVINDERFINRAEVIREKGTNRSQFFRGEVDKYGWVDIGSSFLPSDIIAAFLYAQLENIEKIQTQRRKIWDTYYAALKPLADQGYLQIPQLPSYSSNNAHMFYLVCKNLEERTQLIATLKEQGINAVFHYLSLHSSPYYTAKHDGRSLPHCDHFSDCLVRLPFYYELTEADLKRIVDAIHSFYRSDR